MRNIINVPLRKTTNNRYFSRNYFVIYVLIGIILLGAFLRLYQLGAFNIGNHYYAATVKSMLVSWKNFFFASYEPGGSVTVDKPPLGFWLQAISAFFLGVNGFALALPQAIAGILSIPLLYKLAKDYFGRFAGLIAAFVLAITPVVVSTERNNTIDGTLILVLLLAVWAFIKAVKTNKIRFLILGTFLIGLGFNIKMLQAYLILPALYAFYFFGVKVLLWKKILNLFVATIVLLLVSFSWVIIVDMVPAENRPFIGSSQNNTVMELVFGHNGLKRLVGGNKNSPDGDGAPSNNQKQNPPMQQNIDGSRQPLNDNLNNRNIGNRPGPDGNNTPDQNNLRNKDNIPPQNLKNGMNGGPNGKGGAMSQETGEKGAFRLFIEPLVTEAGWLLVTAIIGIGLVIIANKFVFPLSNQYLGLILWGGWIMTEVVFFSVANMFHAYYLIMLGAPMAALVAAGFVSLYKIINKSKLKGVLLLILITLSTLVFQIVTMRNYSDLGIWTNSISILITILGFGVLTIFFYQKNKLILYSALGILVFGLSVTPLAWSAKTALSVSPDVMLPKSGQSLQYVDDKSQLNEHQQIILDYISPKTENSKYLLAVMSSMDGSSFILETGRPVLTFGGFSGNDDVISVDQLKELIDNGDLKFILDTGQLQKKTDIYEYIIENCSKVELSGLETEEPKQLQQGPGRNRSQSYTLYSCEGN